jgi:hypothetical protein
MYASPQIPGWWVAIENSPRAAQIRRQPHPEFPFLKAVRDSCTTDSDLPLASRLHRHAALCFNALKWALDVNFHDDVSADESDNLDITLPLANYHSST